MSGLSFESLADLPPEVRQRIQPTLLAIAKERSAKVNARYPVVNGIKFDSAQQAARYKVLKMALEHEAIFDLQLWRQVTICEQYTEPDGNRMGAVRFVADFAYVFDGDTILESTAGRIAANRKKVEALTQMGYIVKEY